MQPSFFKEERIRKTVAIYLELVGVSCKELVRGRGREKSAVPLIPTCVADNRGRMPVTPSLLSQLPGKQGEEEIKCQEGASSVCLTWSSAVY